jgi:hypothetical protein
MRENYPFSPPVYVPPFFLVPSEKASYSLSWRDPLPLLKISAQMSQYKFSDSESDFETGPEGPELED